MKSCSGIRLNDIDMKKGRSKVQFCPKGHDTLVTGRYDWKGCIACSRQDPFKDSRIKLFCIRGHEITIVGRDNDGWCNLCKDEYLKIYYENHKEKIKTRSRKQKQDNKVELDLLNKKYREEHKEEIQQKNKEYRIKNAEILKQKNQKYYTEHRNERLLYLKQWKLAHPDYFQRWEKKNVALRKLISLQSHKKRSLRIPSFGQDGILEFYANCPTGLDVDHIVPLCGKLVSGLHVSWNLQYLTHKQNNFKNNKFDHTLTNNDWRHHFK